SADFFGVSFARYASVMAPVNLVSIGATLAVLLIYFGRFIPRTYEGRLAEPSSVIRDLPTFRAGWLVLAGLLAGFFGLSHTGIPVSAIAALGAIILLLVAGRGHRISTRKVMREAPWHIVVFSLGMYLVVYGLRNAGLTAWVTALLDYFATHG